MQRILSSFLLWCAAATANTQITAIESTATQALFRINTDQAGPCSYRASEDASFNPLVHDVNPALFPGANSDARLGSIMTSPNHVFVLGRRTAEPASDGRLYSRALQANTVHWVGVTCGSDNEAVATFQTENPPLGRTAPEAPPFEPTAFGNYAWPTIDWTDPSKSYIDPMTGVLLKRISSSSWRGKLHQNNAFAAAVDLTSAWANSQGALTWPGSAGSLASYSGQIGDPLFLAADLSMILDYQYGALAISGWTPLTTIDDLLVRTFGFGSDASAENRKLLLCLSNDSGNTCDTPEVEIALPLVPAAASSAPPNFPSPSWASWSTRVPYRGREWGTVITTVTSSGHTLTNTGLQSSQLFSRTWKPGGRVLVNGSEIYTIASVNNTSSITTVETMAAHVSPVSFKSLTNGVRVRKKTATGTISFSAGYDIATADEFAMPLTGTRDLCSPVSVTVTKDASGAVASPRPARLCMARRSNNLHVLFAFFPDNGEARLLSNFESGAGFQYHSPDWVQYDGQYPAATVYTNNVWDQSVGTRFYTQINLGSSPTHYSLVQVDYTGDFRAYVPGYYGPTGWPADSLTYTVIGFPSQNRAVDQQVAAFGNAYYDSSIYTVWSLVGVMGIKAAWQAYGPTTETPTFFALQDLATGTVTNVIDTISTYPLRFWGNHSSEAIAGRLGIIGNPLGGKSGQSTSNYLGGPFIVYPTQISKAGSWSSDTSLTAGDADTCPGGIAPQWQAVGAVGIRCVLMRARQPCSDFAGTAESTKFPCPWDSSKSMLTGLAAGDRFWTDYVLHGVPPNGFPGGGPETMRVVTIPIDQGGGVVEFWALRGSERYGNLGGAYDGSGNPGNSPASHTNGWTGLMLMPEARTNAWSWLDSTGAVLSDNYALSATHEDVGPGLEGSDLTSIIQGKAPFTYGVRWNKPLSAQAGGASEYDLYDPGGFAGVDYGGASAESYVSMRQLAAPADERRWFLDLRHMSPFVGVGQEVYAGVGTISASQVTGTTNVYRFTSYPGNSSNIKLYPPLAYAGPYLLQDMSSPNTGDLISDVARWKYCFAYRNGECRLDSLAGQIFVSVPNADARSIADNSCVAGWYAQVNPCAWIPHATQFWGIQVDASRPATDDNYWRKLTIGFSGPGRQYQFGNITPTPDGNWAFMQGYWLDGVRNEILAVKIPPFPKYDSRNRADFVPIAVAVGGGPGTAARVRFGYAEFGRPSDLFCTSRQESCLTDASIKPFAFLQSDSSTPTPCSGGCTINIPGVSGRVVYYVVERLDGGGNVMQAGSLQTAVVP